MPKLLNIAHRGFTKSFPDNTLEAFEAAIKLGVDGIECDLHETADNHFIVFHDNDIEGKSIAEMKLTDVRQVRLKGQYRIPTLEETLELCHGKIMANLEIKLVYSLDKFLEILRANARPEELLLSSFYGAVITEFADLAPEIRRGILTGFTVKDPLKLMSLTKAQVMLPRFGFTTMALIDKLQHRNLSIIVWDCNTPEDIGKALAWKVDGIITDNPDFLARELEKEKR
ncbi:MAG: glycerophosphodiester phosphodiesterase [Dehalococcoidia bacterium]|nr:glycerophosphodiester phosphodiesterase [Dehalococcoidia bacterium]